MTDELPGFLSVFRGHEHAYTGSQLELWLEATRVIRGDDCPNAVGLEKASDQMGFNRGCRTRNHHRRHGWAFVFVAHDLPHPPHRR
jgi:hypothetical protein